MLVPSLLVIALTLVACQASMAEDPSHTEPAALPPKVRAEIGFLHTGAMKEDAHNEIGSNAQAEFGFTKFPDLLQNSDALVARLRTIDVNGNDDYEAEVAAIVGDFSNQLLKVVPAPFDHVQISGLWVTKPRALYVVATNGGAPRDFGYVWQGEAGTAERGLFKSFLLISIY